MKDTSLFKKIITCLMAGFIGAAVLLVLGDGGSISWFPPTVVFPLAGIVLLSAIILPFIRQYKEAHKIFNSPKLYTWLYAFIRNGVAFDLMTFAWRKLFGMQLITPKFIADMPMNRQTGETLTWYYFSYSHTLMIIIAVIQIGGSVMLLFRRTLLFGSIILFALMFNLMLIDIFYHMNSGASIQAVAVTVGILFILLLHYQRLVDFFIKPQPDVFLPLTVKARTKNIIRFSVIVLALLFIYCLRYK